MLYLIGLILCVLIAFCTGLIIGFISGFGSFKAGFGSFKAESQDNEF
jgi:hypothetical protein